MKSIHRLWSVATGSCLAVCLCACNPAGPAGVDKPAQATLPKPALGPIELWAQRTNLQAQEADGRTWDRLAQKAPEIDLHNVKAGDAFRILGEKTGLTIVPDWASLKINPSAEMADLTLKDMTAQEALRSLLKLISGGQENFLDFVVRDGVVKVARATDLAAMKYIEFYDVRDILAAQAAGESAKAADRMADADDRAKIVASTVNAIRTLIQPESWNPTGDATILESSGLLIVKQSPAGHRELAAFLAQWRAQLVRSAAEKGQTR